MIKIDKVDSKKLQFLLAAVSKDDARPTLCGVNFNGAAVGVDGFRLHALNTKSLTNQELAGLNGTFDLGKIRTGENIIDPQPLENGNFPEYHGILPQAEPKEVIAIQPKFLVEFCKHLDKDSMVYLMLRGSSQPMELKGTVEDSDVYGLIMPMHGGNYEEKWKPTKNGESEPKLESQ